MVFELQAARVSLSLNGGDRERQRWTFEKKNEAVALTVVLLLGKEEHQATINLLQSYGGAGASYCPNPDRYPLA